MRIPAMMCVDACGRRARHGVGDFPGRTDRNEPNRQCFQKPTQDGPDTMSGPLHGR
jgi:hypothetical protein